MKIKNRIRADVSQVYNILIPEGKWKEYLDLLDRDGHPNRKELGELLLVFAKHIETLEDCIEDLYFQLELLEGKSVTAPVKPEFKLRTPIDVQADLDTKGKVDCYFVSQDDFKILEKNLNPQLAKTKPEYGYGKEINPKTQKQETCLYYNDLPVFKQ